MEKDHEYSEIIELFSIRPPNPTRNQTAETEPAETKFGLYINVSDIVRPKDIVSDVETTDEPRESTTFKRYSSIEETAVVQYENVAQSREGIERMASTEQILAVEDRNEDTMSLRLSNLGSCRVSPRIPVMMAVSGLMDGVSDIISVCASFAKRLDWQDILRDTARVARMVMFFLHFYGLLIVYKSLPPEEENKESSSYCDPVTFWLAFSYFHITFLSSVFIWIGMLVAIACHFR